MTRKNAIKWLTGTSFALVVTALTLLTSTATHSQGAANPIPLIDSRVDKTIAANGMSFTPIAIKKMKGISSDQALLAADQFMDGELAKQPLQKTAELVSFSDQQLGIQDKAVWKVTYWGAPMKLEGIIGSESLQQPTSQKAVTWVVVEPETGKVLVRFSAGPRHD